MKETVKILTTLAAALLVSLLLATACTNPTNGEPGAPGAPGAPGTNGTNGTDGGDGKDAETPANGAPGGTGAAGYPVISPSGVLSAADLAELFIGNDKVRFISGSGSIQGLVPQGKTLEIAGTVAVGGPLNVIGTVHILETGTLTNSSGSYTLADGMKLQIDGGIFLASALFDGSGLKAGVILGPNRRIIADNSANAGAVNNAFQFLDSIAWEPTTLDGSALGELNRWTAASGKRLILSGPTALGTGSFNVTGKGPLDITGALTIGNNTLTITTGTGAVTVAPAGAIVLNHAGSTLVGAIDVNGKIEVSGAIATAAIPVEVNLADATLTSDNDSAVLTLADDNWSIGTIDLATNSLRIAGAAASELDVGTVKNTAAKTLTFPAIPVTVTLVKADTATLTIAGTSTTNLTVTNVEGAAGLTLGADVEVDAINIAAGSKIIVDEANFADHFTDEAGLIDKVTGLGSTVDLTTGSAQNLGFSSGFTFGPKIVTAGTVTLTATTAFNAIFTGGLESGAVSNAGADNAALTLNGPSTLASLTSGASGKTLTLGGSGKVTVGTVAADENLIISNSNDDGVIFTQDDNTIATGMSLKVENGSVKAGDYLVFGPGTYAAGTAGVTYGDSKITPDSSATLTLGSIVLSDSAGSDFEASGTGTVTLTDNAITISDGAEFTFVKTTGKLALGSGGSISLAEGGKLIGFVDNTGGGAVLITTATQGADGSFKDATYTSGVTPSGTGTYTDDTDGSTGDGYILGGVGGWTITGTATEGGILTSGSDVKQVP